MAGINMSTQKGQEAHVNISIGAAGNLKPDSDVDIRQQKPIELGEHGILDLQKIGWVLRLRWSWLLGTSPSWLWQEFRLPCTNTVHALFQASTYVTVGNGRNTRFWTDCRMDDRSPADVVPTVLQAVQYSRISVANSGLSDCTVCDDLHNNRINSTFSGFRKDEGSLIWS
uniref:Uncharacterized protein n=2 Tax=Triticum TaxID=4564 RepID=A0A8R7PGH2_TRIUA